MFLIPTTDLEIDDVKPRPPIVIHILITNSMPNYPELHDYSALLSEVPMDSEFTIETLEEAKDYIDEAITAIKEQSECDVHTAISEFYGNITSAYFRLNLAWNALGYDNFAGANVSQQQFARLTTFPECLVALNDTDNAAGGSE